MSNEIDNPFLAAETIAARAMAPRSAKGDVPAAKAQSPRGRLVIDEPPPDRYRRGVQLESLASAAGLERRRPLAGLLTRLRADRRLAVASISALLVVVLLAMGAVSGGGADPRLVAASRTIAALRAQARALSAVERQLQGELQTARTELTAAQAQLSAAQARDHTHGKGGRT